MFLKNKVKNYYSQIAQKEWRRLKLSPYHELEFLTTMHFLKKYLPKRGLILDAGGGPGRYTIELAKKGYNVVLLMRFCVLVERFLILLIKKSAKEQLMN